MTIALYLGLDVGSKVDAMHPQDGNPGLGGTQYLMVLLAYYLVKDARHTVYMMANRQYEFGDNGGKYIHISRDGDVVPMCKHLHADILILRDHRKELREAIANSDLKVIFWCHNYVYADFCRYVVKTPQVKCCVFVGKQQYDRYIDNDIIEKSVCIYNLFNDNCNEPRSNDGQTVVFVGAIVEGKGFLELCRMWPGIIKEVPSARLKVIGSGKLYGDTDMGKYGIAPKRYEQQFIPFITDDSDSILPSIEFLGVQGAEKVETFLGASVGIVNPTSHPETFGMAIVEMAAAELPVATYAKNGFYDTVENGKTGLLNKSLHGIRQDIIRLLKDKQLNEELGKESKKFIVKFSPSVIVPQWLQLLDDVKNGTLTITYNKAAKPFASDFKWMRCVLRFIRFKLRMRFFPSLIDIEYIFILGRNWLRHHRNRQ